ncbi:MAG: hypothetical protein WAU39_14200 [Polyangiales bacterium]
MSVTAVAVVAIGYLPLVGLLGSGACEGERFKSEREFLRQPLEQQHEQFMKLPPDKQIPIYLAAQVREPPDTSFCRDIGQSSGRTAIPTIVRFLEAETEDHAKLDLIRAMQCIALVQGPICEPGLLEVARTAAASIREMDWREEAESIVSGLKCSAQDGENHGADPDRQPTK